VEEQALNPRAKASETNGGVGLRIHRVVAGATPLGEGEDRLLKAPLFLLKMRRPDNLVGAPLSEVERPLPKVKFFLPKASRGLKKGIVPLPKVDRPLKNGSRPLRKDPPG